MKYVILLLYLSAPLRLPLRRCVEKCEFCWKKLFPTKLAFFNAATQRKAQGRRERETYFKVV